MIVIPSRKEIATLLLRRSTHTSQHFYTFLPSSYQSRYGYSISRSKRINKYMIPIHHNKCDLISNEANSYLIQLLRFNLAMIYNSIPEVAFRTLREIASESLDFAYINDSQGFFVVCDSTGNLITSESSNFYLFFVFLHNFSSSALTKSSLGQQSVEFDYFLLSPDSFQSGSFPVVNEPVQKNTLFPQELFIQDLFKSCFMYSIYSSVCTDRGVSSSELKRFMTSDNCSTGMITVNVKFFLRVLSVLNESDRSRIDSEIMHSINSLDCIIYDDYLVVRCNEYPVFIRMDLAHPVKASSSQEVCCFDCLFSSAKIDAILCQIRLAVLLQRSCRVVWTIAVRIFRSGSCFSVLVRKYYFQQRLSVRFHLQVAYTMSRKTLPSFQ